MCTPVGEALQIQDINSHQIDSLPIGHFVGRDWGSVSCRGGSVGGDETDIAMIYRGNDD